jgi:hypothetical protein
VRPGIWLAAFVVSVLSVTAHAQAITVGFRHVVEPDAELQKFVEKLKSMAVKNPDYSRIDALFAPRVKTFRKSLDPFQPWTRTDDLTADYLRGAADIMVEQAELPETGPAPDYRPDALGTIVAQVSKGDPFGALKEMPGAVCSPADYKVDRKGATKFAGKYRLDAYSLRFFGDETVLWKRPNDDSRIVARVPPYTLMMFDFDPSAREPWAFYEVSDGRKGYLKEQQPMLGLAQNHVCFGKVKGRYRIVALFGYGL